MQTVIGKSSNDISKKLLEMPNIKEVKKVFIAKINGMDI